MKKSRKRRKPCVRTTLKEEAGRMLLDIGRMVFAGIVIVEILRWQIRGIDEEMLHGILLVIGSAIVAFCNTLGLFMVKREVETEKRSKRTLTSMPIHKGWRRKRGKG
jgi:hypothetical protein